MVETTISVHRNTVSVVDFVRETLTNPQNFPPAAGRRSLGRRSVGVSESDDDEGGATEHKLGCGRPYYFCE